MYNPTTYVTVVCPGIGLPPFWVLKLIAINYKCIVHYHAYIFQ